MRHLPVIALFALTLPATAATPAAGISLGLYRSKLPQLPLPQLPFLRQSLLSLHLPSRRRRLHPRGFPILLSAL